MSQTLPELFPGFTTHRIATEGAEVFARVGGTGPALLALHGYPQTHACWHKVAPKLAAEFTLVVMDLRGYGQSSAPTGDGAHLTYSKRAMAADAVAVMRTLGHGQFVLMGHDRGGRVAYRLALDHPQAVRRLVTLDMVPTLSAWDDMARPTNVGRFHWPFLAQAAPFPETVIGKDPVYFHEHLIASWTAARDLSAFDADALAHYRASFSDPARIHAMCEDYRAGATVDCDYDAADRDAGRRIECPMLALWGQKREVGPMQKPLEIWRQWAKNVQGQGIVSGHFIAEEAPEALLVAILPFLRGT
jgi:haloacetate dehalogenase